jgi:hypothetical protein
MAMPEIAGSESLHRRRARKVLRLIVVDDDRDTVATLTAVLESEGHVVYPVFDGKDLLPAALLRLLESSRERTDRPSSRSATRHGGSCVS